MASRTELRLTCSRLASARSDGRGSVLREAAADDHGAQAVGNLVGDACALDGLEAGEVLDRDALPFLTRRFAGDRLRPLVGPPEQCTTESVAPMTIVDFTAQGTTASSPLPSSSSPLERRVVTALVVPWESDADDHAHGRHRDERRGVGDRAHQSWHGVARRLSDPNARAWSSRGSRATTHRRCWSPSRGRSSAGSVRRLSIIAPVPLNERPASVLERGARRSDRSRSHSRSRQEQRPHALFGERVAPRRGSAR